MLVGGFIRGLRAMKKVQVSKDGIDFRGGNYDHPLLVELIRQDVKVKQAGSEAIDVFTVRGVFLCTALKCR